MFRLRERFAGPAIPLALVGSERVRGYGADGASFGGETEAEYGYGFPACAIRINVTLVPRLPQGLDRVASRFAFGRTRRATGTKGRPSRAPLLQKGDNEFPCPRVYRDQSSEKNECTAIGHRSSGHRGPSSGKQAKRGITAGAQNVHPLPQRDPNLAEILPPQDLGSVDLWSIQIQAPARYRKPKSGADRENRPLRKRRPALGRRVFG